MFDSQPPENYFRDINNEDDNKAIAKRYKRHQAKNRNQFSPTKVAEDRELSTSLLPSPIPKPRSFKWVTETHHVPAEFQTKKLRGKAPWYLHLRFLMTNLPEQLSEDSSGVKSWRDRAVKGGKVFRRYSLGSNLIWGRRCVFSEREIGYPYWLTGNWLVVAYLWGTSKAWVQQADIRDLVSFDSTYRIRVYEHQYYPFDNAAGWARHYEIERKAEGIYHRLFHYQPRPGVVPPPVLPGTTTPYGHSILGDLLNRKVKGLVLASGEKDKGREPSPATNVVIYAPGETPTAPKHGWREMPCMF
ncbi:uncharacterized protein E0L32_006157 [Thyridium curvatum]|uniref:Uncharacterized protein n=1 Tax=Thyridium curvatum TaxID=1093900 RepID=A0A507B121_9PEZI|nr:uncharacterized protein E0L32_006157 [Thyridium curvatum]TPX13427.1 hypothetical protein E0L32_006157 [Thyridium curvatum]